MPKYGFNFLWMYSPKQNSKPKEADLNALDFIAEQGFNFVRIPANYWYWIENFQYDKPNLRILDYFDRYLRACQDRKLHLCLNLHRAPGYCINGANLEKHNLWTDAPAQEAFLNQWVHFAHRFQGVPAEDLSFDLINEPPELGQYGCTREVHEKLMREVSKAIRAEDPVRPLVLDGLDGGNLAMPELADLGVTQSGRGYQPMALSHYQARWWPHWEKAGPPVYPGTLQDGEAWDKERIRKHYEPWRELEAQGVPVHIGEFGCYDQTPQDLALAWFEDLLSIFEEYKWGYSLWEFEGSFGIIGHRRPGTRWKKMGPYTVDQDLMNLLLAHRLS